MESINRSICSKVFDNHPVLYAVPILGWKALVIDMLFSPNFWSQKEAKPMSAREVVVQPLDPELGTSLKERVESAIATLRETVNAGDKISVGRELSTLLDLLATDLNLAEEKIKDPTVQKALTIATQHTTGSVRKFGEGTERGVVDKYTTLLTKISQKSAQDQTLEQKAVADAQAAEKAQAKQDPKKLAEEYVGQLRGNTSLDSLSAIKKQIQADPCLGDQKSNLIKQVGNQARNILQDQILNVSSMNELDQIARAIPDHIDSELSRSSGTEIKNVRQELRTLIKEQRIALSKETEISGIQAAPKNFDQLQQLLSELDNSLINPLLLSKKGELKEKIQAKLGEIRRINDQIQKETIVFRITENIAGAESINDLDQIQRSEIEPHKQDLDSAQTKALEATLIKRKIQLLIRGANSNLEKSVSLLVELKDRGLIQHTQFKEAIGRIIDQCEKKGQLAQIKEELEKGPTTKSLLKTDFELKGKFEAKSSSFRSSWLPF